MRSCVARSHAAQVLKDGDLVLAVNGQPVTSYGDVETIVAACSLAAQATSTPPHHSTDPASPSSSTRAMPAEASHTKSSSPQHLTAKSHEAAAVSNETQRQGDLPKLIKAARPDNSGFNSSKVPMESQQGTVAMPQVSVTICRGAVVEEVEVQLGSEDGLGTSRLIHWCGAMFQVSRHHPFVYSVNQSYTQVLVHL